MSGVGDMDGAIANEADFEIDFGSEEEDGYQGTTAVDHHEEEQPNLPGSGNDGEQQVEREHLQFSSIPSPQFVSMFFDFWIVGVHQLDLLQMANRSWNVVLRRKADRSVQSLEFRYPTLCETVPVAQRSKLDSDSPQDPSTRQLHRKREREPEPTPGVRLLGGTVATVFPTGRVQVASSVSTKLWSELAQFVFHHLSRVLRLAPPVLQNELPGTVHAGDSATVRMSEPRILSVQIVQRPPPELVLEVTRRSFKSVLDLPRARTAWERFSKTFSCKSKVIPIPPSWTSAEFSVTSAPYSTKLQGLLNVTKLSESSIASDPGVQDEGTGDGVERKPNVGALEISVTTRLEVSHLGVGKIWGNGGEEELHLVREWLVLPLYSQCSVL